MGPVRRWYWLVLCASLLGFAQIPDEDELLLGRLRASRRQGQHRLIPGQDPDSDSGVQKADAPSGSATELLLPPAVPALFPPVLLAAALDLPLEAQSISGRHKQALGRSPPVF